MTASQSELVAVLNERVLMANAVGNGLLADKLKIVADLLVDCPVLAAMACEEFCLSKSTFKHIVDNFGVVRNF